MTSPASESCSTRCGSGVVGGASRGALLGHGPRAAGPPAAVASPPAPSPGRQEAGTLLARAQALAGDRVDEGGLLERLVADPRAVDVESAAPRRGGAGASPGRSRPSADASGAWPVSRSTTAAQPVGHLVQRGRRDDEQAEEPEEEQQRDGAVDGDGRLERAGGEEAEDAARAPACRRRPRAGWGCRRRRGRGRTRRRPGRSCPRRPGRWPPRPAGRAASGRRRRAARAGRRSRPCRRCRRRRRGRRCPRLPASPTTRARRRRRRGRGAAGRRRRGGARARGRGRCRPPCAPPRRWRGRGPSRCSARRAAGSGRPPERARRDPVRERAAGRRVAGRVDVRAAARRGGRTSRHGRRLRDSHTGLTRHTRT